MTRAERIRIASRKLREAKRLRQKADEHFAIGDGMLDECKRLCEEANAIMDGREPLRRPVKPAPAKPLH